MANIIDRLIGWVNPHAGISRHFARQRLERAYDAASPRDSWRPRRPGASANTDHRADARKLRAKSRALEQNVSYIAAGFEALVSATIGTGIMPRFKGKNALVLTDLFAEFIKQCDADGNLDFFGIQASAYHAAERDGGSLIRLRWRRPTDNLAVPLQYQVLEIDWLDSDLNQMIGANTIVNGIEYDPLGRRVNYWLFDQHPGDQAIGRKSSARSSPVPAAQIVHYYNKKRPGQGDGVPRLSPVIARVRDLQLYEDAELARKNLETRLSVLVSGDPAQMANPAGYGDGSGDPAEKARQTGDLGELSSGSIIGLPPGTTAEVVAPTAAPGYVDYVKQQLHLIAAGFRVPYEMMTGDMKEVNFSSARVRRLDFRREVETNQWLHIIPVMIEPLLRAFIEAARFAGKIRNTEATLSYSTPRWPHVNPQQDIKAEIDEISAGLCSISEKIRQRGEDPDEVFGELASDIKKLDKLGVLKYLLFMQRGNLPTETADAAADNDEKKDGGKDVD